MSLNYRAIGPWARAHKKSSAVLIVVAVLTSYGIVHAVRGTTASASYVLGTVTRGTLVASVTGNGQISATSQVQLSPKGSGTLTYVAAVNGARVRAGTVIASLDAVSEVQAVRDAQLDLEAARITLQKLQRSQTSSIPDARDGIVTAYTDALDDVLAIFQELPGIRDAADDTVNGGSLNGGCVSSICQHAVDKLLDEADRTFDTADTAYDNAFTLYRATDRTSPHETVTRLMDATADAIELLSHALATQQNILDIIIDDLDSRTSYASTLANLQTRQTDADTASATLSRDAATLRTAARAITDAERALADATDADPLDLASQRNTVQRAELSLQKAQTALADRSVRAPFDGVITGLDARRGDSVSGSTALGTIVTDQHIAELTFNEVDIAKLSVGQKATLTFDAVDDLTLTGSVAAIDALGTVSQGVVNYTVDIALDAQDTRIKPGMSVSAAIVTDVRQNVLIVPVAAVKGSGDAQYVQVPGTDFPATATVGIPVTGAGSIDQRPVTVGLTSDTQAEILSGLTEGDRIIARTVSTSTTTSSQAPSLFQGGTTRGGAGGGRAVIR